jgi:hypothetical protein
MLVGGNDRCCFSFMVPLTDEERYGGTFDVN